jgi:hypothetical protein
MDLISDSIRTEVYDDIAKSFIDALRTFRITLLEAKKSSVFILPRLDVVKNWNDLSMFLLELSNKWNIYKNVYLKWLVKRKDLVASIVTNQDQIKINQIKNKLSSLI